MKTLRFTAIISCFFILLFLLASCSGYNSQMRSHLSDATNYDSYRGEICDIYYFDSENKKVSILSSNGFSEHDVVIEVVFEDYDTVKKFLGGDPNPERSLNEHKFAFKITKENNQILTENGFYDAVFMNTPIDITTSSFLYMDAEFFFIAAVTYNETEYLHFEDGIKNIVEFINDHKSLM